MLPAWQRVQVVQSAAALHEPREVALHVEGLIARGCDRELVPLLAQLWLNGLERLGDDGRDVDGPLLELDAALSYARDLWRSERCSRPVEGAHACAHLPAPGQEIEIALGASLDRCAGGRSRIEDIVTSRDAARMVAGLSFIDRSGCSPSRTIGCFPRLSPIRLSCESHERTAGLHLTVFRPGWLYRRIGHWRRVDDGPG